MVVNKVTFINPPEEEGVKSNPGVPPFSLGYLATEAVKVLGNGRVNVVDAYARGLAIDEIIKEVIKDQYEYGNELVGLTVTEPNVDIVIKIAKKLVEEDPNIKLVFGGIKCILDPKGFSEKLIENGLSKNIEFVCTGDGEKPIKQYLEGVSKDKIPGISYVDEKGGIIVKEGIFLSSKERNDQELNRDFLYKVIKESKGDNGKLRIETYFLTSIGCFKHCAYCSTGALQDKGQKRTMRDKESIKRELKDLKDNHQINYVRFFDSLCFSSEKRTKDILDIIEELGWNKDNFGFRSSGNADTLSKFSNETRDRLALLGLDELEFGTESGSEIVLNHMDKRITIDQIKKTIDQACSRGIKIKTFIMVGYIGESVKDLKETIKLVKELKEKYGELVRLSPFPFKTYEGTNAKKEIESYENKHNSGSYGEVNLVEALNIKTNNKEILRMLEDRTMYNYMKIIRKDGILSPLAPSEISGGASTKEVLKALAYLILISNGLEYSEIRKVIDF